TRSPALNTGPLPANRLRTVRKTISPSSAIQRRCQAPHPNNTETTTTLAQRLTRTVASYGNACRPIALIIGRRDGAGSFRATSAEDNRSSNGSNPSKSQYLYSPVAHRDVLRFAA